MARKIFIIFCVILFIFTFCFNSYIYANANVYSSRGYYQTNNGTSELLLPSTAPNNIDISKTIIFALRYSKVYLFAPSPNQDLSNYTGFIGWEDLAYETRFYNNTNVDYDRYYVSNGTWLFDSTITPNNNSFFNENRFLNNDYPFVFVGSDVLTRYRNTGASVWCNYDSSTLSIISSSYDIAEGGIDYPVIFSNADLNIGTSNLNSYCNVYIKKSTDTDFVSVSTTIFTNNSELYNPQTRSFYVPLHNMITDDLAVGDQIKIEYGWTTLDRLNNPHSYELYNIYTRTVAYTGGSSYEPAPEPGDGGGSDDNNNIDYSNALNEQTQAINQQTDSINQQTNVISGMNDQLFDENVTQPQSIGVDNNAQDNTADLSGLYSSFSGAWHSFDGSYSFPLVLPNHTTWFITLPSAQIHQFMDTHTTFRTLWFSLWWVMLGGYVVFDFKKMYNKFKTGDLQTVMSNSSPIDNVVKEILR